MDMPCSDDGMMQRHGRNWPISRMKFFRTRDPKEGSAIMPQRNYCKGLNSCIMVGRNSETVG